MTTKEQHSKSLAIHKLPVMILGMILGSAFHFSAVNASCVVTVISDSIPDDNMNMIYCVVEEMPQFQGESVEQWIAKNVKYPQEAMEKNIQGKVFVQFVVEKDGSVSNVTIVRGQDSLLNDETLRVIKLMPPWKPGKQHGAPVRVSYTLPINFALKNPEPPQPVQIRNQADNVYQKVDEMPVFSKGQPQVWVAKNVKYPMVAAKNGIQGKVFVQFVVEKDGSVSGIELLRGVHPLLNQEALRVVGSMPGWTPGKIKGEPVRCSYTIPISFRLSK